MSTMDNQHSLKTKIVKTLSCLQPIFKNQFSSVIMCALLKGSNITVSNQALNEIRTLFWRLCFIPQLIIVN